MSIIRAFLFMSIAGLTGMAAQAAVQKVTVLKPRAFFQKGDNELFESLDLKKKIITFNSGDKQTCQNKMVRLKDTLHFACTLTLPGHAKISRRHNLITPVIMTIPFAGTDRRVFITVNDQATEVTYATEFDTTGFDLEVAKFNDDFYRVYAKSALNIVSDAMAKSLKLEVLESRDARLAN